MAAVFHRRAIKAIGASLAALGLLGVTSPAMASGLSCTASEQCRGDAIAMCAPSSLQVEIKTGTGGAALWINRQGPYKARAGRHEGVQTWTLEAFGGAHVLEIEEDGQFLYTGNRGKRFSGTCEETS
ncbi:MAG: hypothetical protein GYB25_02030 [Rhodobacteraceae bacterium]|nr:hypothetical protein [Paracoccaceae bacterium]